MAATLAQIVGDVADELEAPRADIKAVIDTFFETIAERLSEGEEVTLSGYISLKYGYRPGKKKGAIVRNPFDGTTRKLDAATPAKITIKARPLAKLKAAVPSATSREGRAIKSAAGK
jgi:nucleoid DNA-binding protein